MPIQFRQLLLIAILLCSFTTGEVGAQTGIAMGLLAVTAEIGAVPQDPAPTTADTLAAVDRILALWPELVGRLPAGDPRYNTEDIGHIAYSSGVGTIVRSVMTSRMIAGMREAGIKIPDNPTSGSPRPVDRDDNGGVKRKVTRAQLEKLQEDTDIVKRYFAAMSEKLGHKMPVNENGLSVADWQRIKTLLRGLGLVSK